MGRFSISFIYCYYSSFSKKEVGLWSLRVEKYEEDANTVDEEFYKEMSIVGAYYPGWVAPNDDV
jgi:hypothetical protein